MEYDSVQSGPGWPRRSTRIPYVIYKVRGYILCGNSRIARPPLKNTHEKKADVGWPPYLFMRL